LRTVHEGGSSAPHGSVSAEPRSLEAAGLTHGPLWGNWELLSYYRTTMRLLVADDDPSLRTALRMVLEDAGHVVVEASTTLAARTAIGEADFDLVLIDAGMDGMGTSLWGELHVLPDYRGRTLLMTGDLGALGPMGSHEAVLGKPFDFDHLVHRIEGVGARA